MRKMVLLAVCLPFAALADDKNKCLDARDHHVAISGCSEIIRRDPKDAIAYYLRGNALAKNGDLGQAIADFSKAIALNPGFAPAYDSRGAAYVAKGDYVRAVADVTKAGELAPKKGLRAAKGTVTATKDKAPAGIAKGVEVKPPTAGTAAPTKMTEQQGQGKSDVKPRAETHPIGTATWWRAMELGE